MLDQMPAALLTEWMALFMVEAEEQNEAALERDMGRRAAGALEQARSKAKSLRAGRG